MFRKIVKKSQELTIKPLILWYLKKERRFSFRGLTMTVYQGVFHPLLFHSTLILVNYLQKLPLQGKTFLEPGCGCGLVSLLAAKAGADVIALDINELATENTKINAFNNNLSIEVLQSDLFAEVAKKPFNYIFINPPYYPNQPKNKSEMAWYCGENFEYFEKLFFQLPDYYNTDSEVVMILSEDCDLKMIEQIAQKYDQKMELILSKSSILEQNFLFRIVKSNL